MKKCQPTGFTLIEILIVVILLGILATVIIPKILYTTEDAKLNTLKTNLSIMRKALELYYNQHNRTYPGTNGVTGNPAGTDGAAAAAFGKQLLRYTAVNGSVSTIKDETHKFGPYVIGGELPYNPYNNDNKVKCDISTTDITARDSDGSTGWIFYTKSGILFANDGDHDDL